MPRYIIDERALRRNLEILKGVADRTGAKILLAQKAFSCAATYPLCAKYLAGTTASSLFEARHGHDFFGGETHVFAPAFAQEEMDELLSLVDHIVFNSPRQVALYGEKARARGVSVGLRVNPEVSVATTPAYDPCRPSSRLGARLDEVSRFLGSFGSGVCGLASVSVNPQTPKPKHPKTQTPKHPDTPLDGLHFHCLCEQGVEELRKVLAGFEEKFGGLLPAMKWVNFGGGHHITRADYDVDGLVALVNGFRERHPHLDVYLEPGEAVALNAGTLESRVLEIQPRGADGIANAILDTSAACHMPDVLEMPYTPRVVGAQIVDAEALEEMSSDSRPRQSAALPHDSNTQTPKHSNTSCLYRFGGPTCLAGDEIGTYAFAHPLKEGDVVVFEDMAIYSMVKNNTFNGLNLPEIAIRRESGEVETIRTFGYGDFASRLG